MPRIESSISNGRILVVDDDAGIRTLFSALLKSGGWEIDFAADGREALTALARAPYDVVILDLMMQVTGAHVIAELEKEIPPKRCVIVVSAASETMIGRLESPVIHSKIRKPFDIDDLLTAINNCRLRECRGTS